MKTVENNMEKIFGVTETTVVEPKKEYPVATTASDELDLKQDLNDSYNQTRENLQQLIDQGKDAMDEMLNIAKAGQHPRAFEVYGKLLDSVVSANKELLSIQKQMRDMDGKKKEVTNTNIDKAVFVGSTADLAKMLKNGNNKD
jgi:uncharacterized protein YicC (UPF0701 family)